MPGPAGNDKAKPPRPPFGDITNQHTPSAEGSATGPASSGNVPANTSNDAADGGAAAAAPAQSIADIVSAWKGKTPAEKEEWTKKAFGAKGPPWKGEVAYDNGEDIEYEMEMGASKST